MNVEPEFPLRVIFDDGEMQIIESPDELLSAFFDVDSLDPAARIWIRDALDRTVALRISQGMVLRLEAL